MDRCTVGRWTHLKMQRRVESGEVRRRYHSFGHALLRKTKKENNLIMENQQQTPVTQGVNDNQLIEMNTQENNKLIAEFMGMQHTDIGWYDNEETLQLQNNTFDELQFHEEWNWLMPVVEKINNTGRFEVNIGYGHCYISDGEDKLTLSLQGKSTFNAIYKSVVEFIKWYNKQEL